MSSTSRSTDGAAEAQSSKQTISWTTARCQRLLRPIASRLVALRKLEKRDAAKPNVSATAKEPPKEHREADASTPIVDASPEHQKDPDWLGHLPKKKGQKRFTGRHTSTQRNQQSHTQVNQTRPMPGEVSLPTPYLRKISNIDEIVTASPLSFSSTTGGSSIPNRGHDVDDIAPGPESRSRSRRRGPRKPKFRKPDTDFKRSEKDKLACGLIEPFKQLILATSDASEGFSRRSLFSMCLRQVPAYIELEEKSLKDEDANDDALDRISDEIYDDLESLGHQGWRPLAVVVRAHGVRLLVEAIANNLIGKFWANTFIHIAQIYKAEDEAEKFAAALIGTARRKQQRAAAAETLSQNSIQEQSEDSLQWLLDICAEKLPLSEASHRRFTPNNPLPDHHPIHMALDFARRSNRWDFLFKEFVLLIESGALSLDFIASRDLGDLWRRAVGALSPLSSFQVYYGNVALLFSAALRARAMGVSNQMLDQLAEDFGPGLPRAFPRLFSPKGAETFNSLATSILSSVSAIGLSTASLEDSQGTILRRADWVLRYLALEIVENPDNSEMTSSWNVNALIGDLILQLCCIPTSNEMWKVSISRSISVIAATLNASRLPKYETSTTLDSISTFVCQIAKDSGRGTKDNGFPTLKRILTKMAEYAIEDPSSSSVLRDMIVHTSRRFAKEAKTSESRELVASMEALLDSRNQNKSGELYNTSQDDNVPPGYRWDDVIDEWLAVTPAPGLKEGIHAKSTYAAMIEEESEEDESPEAATPIRPPTKRTSPDVTERDASPEHLPSHKRQCSDVGSLPESRFPAPEALSEASSQQPQNSGRAARDALRERRLQMRAASDALLGSRIAHDESDADEDDSGDEDELSFERMSISEGKKPLAAKASAETALRRRSRLLISSRFSAHSRLRPSLDIARSDFEDDADDVDF
ncbi:hypothetical protein NA57DRAFT_53315 [Rhizodiscina lignyota]|uniref:Uncharacterized protein n=1 Tax=Rhizodiscina lignyota TaxID=1504668 RepID=A0A9P4ING3_9PEZI|nr:hypothetical protein NA57DRAFT_53315 [Rhizodiscina lignyota]